MYWRYAYSQLNLDTETSGPCFFKYINLLNRWQLPIQNGFFIQTEMHAACQIV